MGEHSLRYRPLADALTQAGYVVYANEHRGHGKGAAARNELGEFGPRGFAGLVDDMALLEPPRARRTPGPAAHPAGPQHGQLRHAVLPGAAQRTAGRRGAVRHHRARPARRRTAERLQAGRHERRIARRAHPFRLAQPRPGPGRCLHRRSAVRLHRVGRGHGLDVCQPGRADARRDAHAHPARTAALSVRRRRGPGEQQGRSGSTRWCSAIARRGCAMCRAMSLAARGTRP